MIECIINGRRAYPDNSQGLKVVRQNPVMRETKAYTLELSFPLTIVDNLRVFGMLGRIDTVKVTETLADCRISDGTEVIISGEGVITDITPEAVKLQVRESTHPVYGRNASMYIDECITFPTTQQLIELAGCEPDSNIGPIGLDTVWKTPLAGGQMLVAREGENPAIAAFTPVYNTKTTTVLNQVILRLPQSWPLGLPFFSLRWPVPQPGLLYVIHKAWQVLGYEVTADYYDSEPWRSIYIASVLQTENPADGLPHWTIETLLDEFRKLFNAVYTVRADGTVTIGCATDADGEPLCLEPADDFQGDIEEEGGEDLSASNISYKISQSSYRNWRETTGGKNLESVYETMHFDTLQEAQDAADAMQKPRQWRTTIFDVEKLGRHFAPIDSLTLNNGRLEVFGVFDPLIRNGNSEDEGIQLRMVPAPVADTQQTAVIVQNTANGPERFDDNITVAMPCLTPGDEHSNSQYTPISKVISGDAELPKRSDTEVMQLFFLEPSKAYSRLSLSMTNYYGYVCNVYDLLPMAYTDPAVSGTTGSNASQMLSFRLHHIPDTYTAIGGLHSQKAMLQNNAIIAIPFLCEGMPDPSRTFQFRGKRFRCLRIEATLNADGLSKMKTGYFYKME